MGAPPIFAIPGVGQRHKLPSASGGITRLALARIRDRGLNASPLLRRANLTVSQVDDPESRLNVASQVRFLEIASEALGDQLLGFHLAQNFELQQIGLLYYVMASSETLLEALKRAERYSTIVNEGIAIRCLSSTDLSVRITYVGVPRHLDRH